MSKAALAKWGLIALLPWPILLVVLAYIGINKWIKTKQNKDLGVDLLSSMKDPLLKSNKSNSAQETELAFSRTKAEMNIGPLCQEKEFCL